MEQMNAENPDDVIRDLEAKQAIWEFIVSVQDRTMDILRESPNYSVMYARSIAWEEAVTKQRARS